MNFTTFSVETTNVFPIANTVKGGQLITEFNLRSRESVATDPEVKYMIGPSYTHSMDDFKISLQQDELNNDISTTVLQISSGKCVLNGHFVENLAPMLIDISIANSDNNRADLGQSKIKGKCCVGLRAMYSTEATIAGSIKAENSNDMYEGIQVVILPANEFKLPSDTPNDQSQVTAHLKLGEFIYQNGQIVKSSVVQNADKIKNIDGSRIANIDNILSNEYISKSNLDPHKLYVFASKQSDTSEKLEDTWCSAIDSLMVWDSSPTESTNNPNLKAARFTTDAITGQTQLLIPHKQVDGMTNTNGDKTYYQPVTLNMPAADYILNTPGTVTSKYTQHIKKLNDKVNRIYDLNKLTGKLIGIVDSLELDANGSPILPKVNSSWNYGDYILVLNDSSVEGTYDSTVTSPATMYVVSPGQVTSTKYVDSINKSNAEFNTIPPSSGKFAALTGMFLGTEITDSTETPNTTQPDVYNEYWGLDSTAISGRSKIDYFIYQKTDENEVITDRYYYAVDQTEGKTLKGPVIVTAEIPYAGEDLIGGFKNVSSDKLDAGYVRLDENGNLYLVDYSLLRSGVLAYQLGEDYTSSTGSDNAQIQQELDDYVNDRVAFANSAHLEKANQTNSSTLADVINVTIQLEPSETASEIIIKDIDSRFNTSVYLHINGTADSNTTVRIKNCQKLRIDSNVGGAVNNKPNIILENCSLYYDPSVLDMISNISGLSLWYEQYSDTDPNLLVNGMTVQALDAPIVADNLDYWSTATPNDNHMRYALQSITFGSNGNIIGFGLYVQNSTTANIQEGRSILVSAFEIPQGSSLSYPVSKLTKSMKLSGSFITAYPTSNNSNTVYQVIETMFTAYSGTYQSDDTVSKGTISFSLNTFTTENVEGISISTPIDGWDSTSYHIFTGGALT